MFERGLKEGVYFKFIEECVEKIVKNKFEKSKQSVNIEEEVDMEMEYIEYRIWYHYQKDDIIPQLDSQAPSTSSASNWKDFMELFNNYMTENQNSDLKYSKVFSSQISKNTHYCYARVKESLTDEMNNYNDIYDNIIKNLQTEITDFDVSWLTFRYRDELMKEYHEMPDKITDVIQKIHDRNDRKQDYEKFINRNEDRKHYEDKLQAVKDELNVLEKEEQNINITSAIMAFMSYAIKSSSIYEAKIPNLTHTLE